MSATSWATSRRPEPKDGEKGPSEPARGTGEDENSVCLATASVMLPLDSAHTLFTRDCFSSLSSLSLSLGSEAAGVRLGKMGYTPRRRDAGILTIIITPQQRQHNKICESQDKLPPSRHEQARLSGSFLRLTANYLPVAPRWLPEGEGRGCRWTRHSFTLLRPVTVSWLPLHYLG